MGASESKLVFKQGIFKLQENATIAADDPYWTGFWELPESTEDVFTLFSANDIRRTRDTSLPNLETLLLAVTSRLFALKNHAAFPSPDLAPEKDALNCIRVLTRVLPFLYESDHLDTWEDNFFWTVRRRRTKQSRAQGEVLFDEANPDPETPASPNDTDFEDAKPLAEELIDTLVDLLFFTNFTVLPNGPVKSRVTYSIWASGVGCNSAVGSNAHVESNRTEVVRLLLTLASKSMYLPANVLPTKGVRALTYLVTCPDKQIVLSMLCSFLNTALKFQPGSWTIPYNHMVIGDPKHLYVATSLQFLLALVVYSVPEDGTAGPRKNNFRHFLGRLHRPQDFQFICDGMLRTLHQPVTATSTYLPGAQKPVRWAAEMIMLFWESIQCNKRFRTFVVDTDRGHDFLVLLVYYAIENRTDPSKQGIVRMCIFVLQTLSVERGFGDRLKKPFDKQETLPASIRIDNWNGTYGDFLIVSIHTLLTGSKGKLDAVYPALLATINNVAPYLENLNALSSLKLLQLYTSMSSPSFLLANDSNHDLLASLLEAMNAIIEHKYNENPTYISLVLKHRKRFETLRTFTLESGQEEIARLEQQRKEQSPSSGDVRNPSRTSHATSTAGLRSPAGVSSPLSNVPEEENSAFAIGEDDDSDDEAASIHQPLTSSSVEGPVASPVSTTAAGRRSRTGSVESSATADDTLPTQLRGMSEKARGKMPAGAPTFSRTSSTHSLTTFGTGSNPAFAPTPQWLETWLPTLPLHTILTLIAFSFSNLPTNNAPPPPPSASPTAPTAPDPSHDSPNPPAALPSTIEATPPKTYAFEWTPLSLGWYMSLLWSFACAAEMAVERGTVGVWNGTRIRLFRVANDPQGARGPTLLQPRGAVDAVGRSVVQRIGGLSLRGAAAAAAATAAAAGTTARRATGDQPSGNGHAEVRDV